MTLIADFVHIKVKRGELLDTANELVSEWFQYHMRDLYKELGSRIEDSLSWDSKDLHRNFNMRVNQFGSSALSYDITGYACTIGMTEIFMEFIARVGLALRRIKPFVKDSSIEFNNDVGRGLVRSPWVFSSMEGIMLNGSQKELIVRQVGNVVRTGNGRLPVHMFGDTGPLEYDTQLDEIWVMGEPNAVNDTISMIRDQFRTLSHRTNDGIMQAVRHKLSAKVVCVIRTIPTEFDIESKLLLLNKDHIETCSEANAHLSEYKDICDEFLVGKDKFNCIHAKLVCPGMLLNQLHKDHGNYSGYDTDWVQTTITTLNTTEVPNV